MGEFHREVLQAAGNPTEVRVVFLERLGERHLPQMLVLQEAYFRAAVEMVDRAPVEMVDPAAGAVN